MWSYILLLGVVFVLLIVFVFYIVNVTYMFIKKYVKNKFLCYFLSFLPILLFVPGIFIDAVNAIVVDIHLIIIVILTKLVFFIVGKIINKKFNEYLIITIAIILTTTLMVHGYYSAHSVIQTNYSVYTTKSIGSDKFRIVQISDSHLGNTMTGKDFINYMEDINKLSPDIVVVTGDFVDDDSSYEDMIDGTVGLGKLKTKYGVYFVYGNHDKGYYNNRSYNDSDIRSELKKNNVTILEDSYVNVTDSIVLVGRQDAEVRGRITAKKLVDKVDKDKYIIMLDHQPNDYENEKDMADLVLSGHTHGGQLFPLGQIAVALGVNDMAYGIKTIDSTTFIVNSGISDWAIKFKTGTVAEYTIIDILKN